MSQETDIPVIKNAPEVKFTEEFLKRFWSHVNKNGPLPDQSNPHYVGLKKCWEWTANRHKYGYGKTKSSGKHFLCHRISWEIHNVRHPGRLWVCHQCDNPSCVNPAHLFIGTGKDNANDRDSKGRGNPPSGDRHGSKTRPESIPFGDRNGTRTHPECHPRGEGHIFAKLSDDKVREIRKRYAAGGVKQRDMAEEFGVVISIISRVVTRTIWTHVPDTE